MSDGVLSELRAGQVGPPFRDLGTAFWPISPINAVRAGVGASSGRGIFPVLRVRVRGDGHETWQFQPTSTSPRPFLEHRERRRGGKITAQSSHNSVTWSIYPSLCSPSIASRFVCLRLCIVASVNCAISTNENTVNSEPSQVVRNQPLARPIDRHHFHASP